MSQTRSGAHGHGRRDADLEVWTRHRNLNVGLPAQSGAGCCKARLRLLVALRHTRRDETRRPHLALTATFFLLFLLTQLGCGTLSDSCRGSSCSHSLMSSSLRLSSEKTERSGWSTGSQRSHTEGRSSHVSSISVTLVAEEQRHNKTINTERSTRGGGSAGVIVTTVSSPVLEHGGSESPGGSQVSGPPDEAVRCTSYISVRLHPTGITCFPPQHMDFSQSQPSCTERVSYGAVTGCIVSPSASS